MYHRIAKDVEDSITISPKNFEIQLEELKKNFYLPDPLEIIKKFKNNQFDIPSNTALLTFDDGYEDNFKYALPLLRKYKIKAIVFLISNYIGKYNLWNHKYPLKVRHMDVREITKAKDVFVYGCHTANHFNLVKMSKPEIVYEIYKSKRYLDNLIGHSLEYFSYPFGYFNEEIIKIVKKYFVVSFSTFNKGLFFSWNLNPHAIKRINPLEVSPGKITEYIFRFRNKYIYK